MENKVITLPFSIKQEVYIIKCKHDIATIINGVVESYNIYENDITIRVRYNNDINTFNIDDIKATLKECYPVINKFFKSKQK